MAQQFKCPPVETRKNITMAEAFARHGIDFVAVPVRDDEHKKELIALVNKVLEEMEEQA